MFFTTSNWKIFVAGFFAFVILNTFENVLHYNIGRTSDDENVDVANLVSNPTPHDWKRIILVMFIFAILQGLLTVFIRSFE